MDEHRFDHAVEMRSPLDHPREVRAYALNLSCSIFQSVIGQRDRAAQSFGVDLTDPILVHARAFEEYILGDDAPRVSMMGTYTPTETARAPMPTDNPDEWGGM